MFARRFTFFAFSIALLAGGATHAQENTDSTPSGSWRWTHELDGETIDDLVRVQLGEKGSLTGKYIGNDREIVLRNGSFKDGVLSFDFQAEVQDQDMTFSFRGEINDDAIDGTVDVKTDSGTYDFPWKPRRSVQPADVVGKWTFTVVTPNDETIHPTLTLSADKETLSGKYKSQDKDITPTNLKINEDGELVFDIVDQFNGNRLDVSFTGRPYGDDISGVLNYSVNGNVGDLDFTATRTPKVAKPDVVVEDANALAIRTLGLTIEKNSPRLRGVGGTAVYADDPRLADDWNKEKNVVWSADLPGLGWGSPVVWGDKVFVSTVVADDSDNDKPKAGLYLGQGVRDPAKGVHHWMVYCFDLNSGKELWKHEAHVGEPKVPRHPKSSYAAETPATDGERLYVLFGDVGLYCYDLDGKPLWNRPLEAKKTFMDYGAAASPVVHDGQVIVVYDNLEASWIASFDAKTGDENWRTPRDEERSWATPLVWKNDQRTEIVVNGKNKNRSYDLNGKLLWEFDGDMSSLVIPSPFAAHGMCYIASGYVGDSHRPTFAIKPGANGDIAPGGDFADSPHIAWYKPTASAYNTTQLVYGDFLYTLYDRGHLTCHNAKTGEMIYGKKRFTRGGSFTASPWAYNGKIFCLTENGLTYVMQAGPEYKVLGANPLDELTLACPAVVDGKLLIRTASKLYCIGGQ